MWGTIKRFGNQQNKAAVFLKIDRVGWNNNRHGGFLKQKERKGKVIYKKDGLFLDFYNFYIFEKNKKAMKYSDYVLILVFFAFISISFATPTNWGTCGDGVVLGTEQCDEGGSNGLASSCCNSDCTLRDSSHTCRGVAGTCDIAETCDGVHGSCPTNLVHGNDHQCSVGDGLCVLDAYCDGFDVDCLNTIAPEGTSCDIDNDLCTPDRCDALGVCQEGITRSFDDGNWCNGVESCDPTTGDILAGTPPDCDDGNSCTVDSCDNIHAICVNRPLEGTYGPCAVQEDGGYYAVCQWGEYTCNGTALMPDVQCVGAVYPADGEICGNGIDDNCDGLVDEGCDAHLISCDIDSDCNSVTRSQCQDVICDVRTYTCLLQNKPEYTPCDDGNPCTSGDFCDEAMCVGNDRVCDDSNDCTKDSCNNSTGLCVYNPIPMFHAPCDAYWDLCSLEDVCDNQGNCHSGYPLYCPTPDDCNNGVCNAETGACDTVPVTSGTCNDGYGCTNYDVCVSGTCHGADVTYTPGSCYTASCTEPHGTVTYQLTAGYCYINGQCVANGTASISNPCVFCDVSKNVFDYSWPNVGSAPVSCNDDLWCTENDTCNFELQRCQGTSVSCAYLNNQCADGACSEAHSGCYSIYHNGQPCNDGDPCTVNEQCLGDTCAFGDATDCSYLITDAQCQYVSCDSMGSGCYVSDYSDGTSCTLDNNVCSTGTPTCQSGVCTAGTVPVCNEPHGQCSWWVCDDPVYGCTQHLNGSTTHCTPTSACYTDGLCADNADDCIDTVALSCTDNNPCTNDFCDYVLGCYHEPVVDCVYCTIDANCTTSICYTGSCVANQCQYTPKTAGYSCADNTVCNGDETCDGFGVCVSGSPRDCDDLNSCTDDFCNAVTGCYHTNNDANTCTDGLYCTINDHCSAGSCVTDPYTDCSLSDTACATYTCTEGVSSLECSVAYHNAASCNDGDPCTENDQCDNMGGCYGNPITCPSGDGQCINSYTCVGGTCEPNYASASTLCTGNGDLCWIWECDSNGHCLHFSPNLDMQSVPITVVNYTITCTATDQCAADSQCNPSTGLCPTAYQPDNTACNDENACSQVDVCLSGMCTGTDYVTCTPLDQCHDAGTCDTMTGICDNPEKSDYTPCDDNSVCTSTDVCLLGVCTGTSPIDCTDPNPCLTGQCDSMTGCYSVYNDGASCDDNNDCTTGTTCLSGDCPAGTGTPVTCTMPDPCTAASCLVHGGCTYDPIADCHACNVSSDCPDIPCMRSICQPNHTCTYVVDDTNIIGCVDSVYCNGLEYCSSGVCFNGSPPSCDDSNECTTDSCDSFVDACTHTPRTGSSCTSTNLCAITAECTAGAACVPVTTTTCDPAAACHVGMGCDPSTGVCMYHLQFDGTPCDDSNACTTVDQCNNGTCVGNSPVVCTPMNDCHYAGTCDTGTGSCSNPTKPNGSPCNDGLFCTYADSCNTGSCSGTPGTCDATPYDTQCQYVTCDESGSQCVVNDVTDGSYCDTGAPSGVCSAQDICVSGACVDQYATGTLCRAQADECDVAEYCGTSDSCPSNSYVTDGTDCQTDLYCSFKTCQVGVCTLNSTRTCGDGGNPCVTGVCDENLKACTTPSKPDYTACSTGNSLYPCIAFEECLSGTCSPHYATTSVGCTDNDECTTSDHCSGSDNTCIPGTLVDCTMYNDMCSVGVCDSLTGSCSAAPIHDGVACDADGLACTVNDTCVSGTCVAGPTRDCSSLSNSCGYGYCAETPGYDDGQCLYNFTSDACNPDHCTGGCTYTIDHWQKYRSTALTLSNRVPWPDNLENQILCGKTWVQWAMLRAKGNAWRKLAQSYISTVLNIHNGACLPPALELDVSNALILLQQCRISISTFDKNASPYKNFAVRLDAYCGGLYGPGNCIDESCATLATENDPDPCMTTANSFYTRKLQRDVGEGNGAVQSAAFATSIADPSECHNGQWDFSLGECHCHYGWDGLNCDTCASPVDADHIFLCVPTRLESPHYLLRSIPADKLDRYLGQSNSTLPFVSVPNYPAVYPGTEGLDCFCREVEVQGVASRGVERDLIFTVTDNQDLLLYIDIIENDLGQCEITWEGYNNLPVATTVFIEVENDAKPYKIATWTLTGVLGFFVFLMAISFLWKAGKSMQEKTSSKYYNHKKSHKRDPERGSSVPVVVDDNRTTFLRPPRNNILPSSR